MVKRAFRMQRNARDRERGHEENQPKERSSISRSRQAKGNINYGTVGEDSWTGVGSIQEIQPAKYSLSDLREQEQMEKRLLLTKAQE